MQFDDPIFILAIVFCITVFIIPLRVAYVRRRTRINIWGGLAGRLGLLCESGTHLWSPVRVTGIYHGYPLTLDSFMRHYGKSSKVFTRVVVDMRRPAQMRLVVYDEKITGKIGKIFGAQDIQVGVEAIDRRFMIKGEPEQAIRDVLSDQELREKLLAVPSLHIEIREAAITFEKRGIVVDEVYLQNVFDVIVMLGDRVDNFLYIPHISGN